MIVADASDAVFGRLSTGAESSPLCLDVFDVISFCIFFFSQGNSKKKKLRFWLLLLRHQKTWPEDK
jgi:hypothetical protein